MNTKELVNPRPLATAMDKSSTGLIVAVPFYRNEHLVDRFTQSLLACADEIKALKARVVFFNDSPDYPALGAALDQAAKQVGTAFGLSIRTNATNQGWLKTTNLAMQDAVTSGADVLLFNSDTVVFPGAIAEMVRVSRLDPMIGFVNPRSNNATLANLPIGDRFIAMPPAEAHAAFRIVSRMLPPLTYAPTSVGFAMLIRLKVLLDFGFFDEIYGGGYNEENDLVMRAGRSGYRAVLANHAFVWHEGEQSLGQSTSSKQLVEEANRAILVERYPEYPNLIKAWFDGVDHTAERLISAFAPGPDGRLQIAFDFSSFGSYHSGTQKAGAQILKHAGEWKDKFEVFVLCDPNTYAFHEMEKTGIERRDPHGPERFAAIFRVGQPFDWDTVVRLTLKGGTVGFFMLDTIALDCSHLYSAELFDMWQYVVDHSDFIIFNSEFTAQQYASRFAHIGQRRQLVSLHSLDTEDYLPPPTAEGVEAAEDIQKLEDGYVLVFGNHYPHKAVGAAANRLAAAYPDQRFVALGLTQDKSTLQGASSGVTAANAHPDDRIEDLPNLTGFRVGTLSNADIEMLQRKARIIVMPSHYEGFGLPVPEALALRKPIVVRSIPPLLEIHAKLGASPNVHFFDSLPDLIKLMKTPPAWTDTPTVRPLTGDSRRAANDVRGMIEAAVANANYATMVDRFRIVHTIYSLAGVVNRQPPSNPVDQIARRVGGMVEHVSQKLLRNGLFYRGSRAVFRGARWVGNLLK